ncbi:YadA-like family protein [Bartonella sp. AA18HLJMS]|uniref:YadA-like family protein n=1 Tax=Bartonella sp. AA18HLJMS TaxID=3243430 RepID=UPI0035D09A93
MKKIYTTPHTLAVSNLKNSCSSYRLPFIKTLSLVSVAVFLSNASPVFACDLWGNVAQYFGGGANIRKSIAPTYIISGGVYRDVGSAFEKVNREFQGVYQQFQIISSNHLVQQNSAGTITVGATKGGTVVDFTNNSRAARVLTGVADAALSPTSNQAVNGSQLYKLGSAIAKSFGGGAGYDCYGEWIVPTFTVNVVGESGKGTVKHYKNVADAFTGVGDSFVNLNKKVENLFLSAIGDQFVRQNSAGVITIGANKDGAVVDFTNAYREARVITGVRDGAVNLVSEQAVNGSQLYKLGIVAMKSFGGGADYQDGNLRSPTFTVKVFDKDGNGTEKDYHNVADAFTGVNSSFTNLDKKIENIVINAAGESLVKQDATSGLITIGGKVSGTKVSIANIDNAVRTLSGVGAGSIAATSTDAINGSQLYSMSNVVAGYFGGGAGYKDGNWSAPTFTVKVFDKDGKGAEENYTNVADAFTGVNSSFTNLDKKIENIVINAAGDSLVKQDAASGLITIGGKVSGARVSIANIDNAVRTLSGVNAGSITATSTDAINGSQFYSMSNRVASYFSDNAGYDEGGNWRAPTFTVKVFDQNGSGTENNYENVADALTGVSSSFTNLNKKIESVTGDSFIKQNSAGLITIGGSKGGDRIDIANSINASRILSGVRGGAFNKDSTEAINGGQLYRMTQAFASYFGGGAGVNEKGKWVPPTFTVKAFDKDGNETENTYTSVADAFAGVNSAFTTLNHEIVEIKKTGSGEKTKPSQNGDNISDDFPFMRSASVKRSSRALGDVKAPTTVTIAAKSPLTQVSFMDANGKSRRLFDISAGDISVNSSDAINGAQLYSISNQIAAYFGGGSGYQNGEWSAPTFTVKAFDEKGNETEIKYSSVADAFAGVNNAVTTLNHQITKIKDSNIVKPMNIPSQNGDNISDGFPFMRSASAKSSSAARSPLANEEKGAYDVSRKGVASKITNVENGVVDDTSQDDISESQFERVSQRVSSLEEKAKDFDQKVDKIDQEMLYVVKYDKDEAGHKTNKISLVGADGSQPVVIDNVGDGRVEAGSKRAVNGNEVYDFTQQQMKSVLDDAHEYTNKEVGSARNEAKFYTDMKFEALSYDIKNVRKEARQAAAIGLAVSNLRYFDDPGSLSVSFAGGLWRGQSAFAIGAGYTSEDGKIRSNLSATSAGGQWGVGGGITLKLK